MITKKESKYLPNALELYAYTSGGLFGAATEGIGGTIVAIATVYGLSTLGKLLD